jgi:hypothetical protein
LAFLGCDQPAEPGQRQSFHLPSRRALELVGEQQKEEYQGYLDHLQAMIDGAGEREDG